MKWKVIILDFYFPIAWFSSLNFVFTLLVVDMKRSDGFMTFHEIKKQFSVCDQNPSWNYFLFPSRISIFIHFWTSSALLFWKLWLLLHQHLMFNNCLAWYFSWNNFNCAASAINLFLQKCFFLCKQTRIPKVFDAEMHECILIILTNDFFEVFPFYVADEQRNIFYTMCFQNKLNFQWTVHFQWIFFFI